MNEEQGGGRGETKLIDIHTVFCMHIALEVYIMDVLQT